MMVIVCRNFVGGSSKFSEKKISFFTYGESLCAVQVTHTILDSPPPPGHGSGVAEEVATTGFTWTTITYLILCP